jgi:hypothetical protein
MSVSTYLPSNASTQTAAVYPTILDGNSSVFARIADSFAPHAQATPDLTVALDAGHLMSAGNLIEVAAQSTAAVTAPTTNPRIDRIVIGSTTGIVAVVTGTEAASPAAPTIPSGSSPVAQVLLQTTSTAITNSMITDERDFTNLGSSTTDGLLGVQVFASSGTYTPTPGTAQIIVEVQGGGGSGGGSGATSSSQGAGAGGGAAGAYAKSRLTSGFSGASVVVGAGGAAPAAGANDGNPGGASTFGTTITAPGGPGGHSGIAYTPPAVAGGSTAPTIAIGGNIVNATGEQGHFGFVLGSTVVIGGTGGTSYFGGGGVGGGAGAGAAATSAGAGGGGASAIRSSAAAVGGAGANGLVIIYEYA